MKPTIVSLRRHFTVLVAVLALIGVAQLIAGQALLNRLEQRSAGIGRAQSANQALLASMVNAETGVRGYQLTGDPGFLEPYTTAMTTYPVALRQARASAPTPSVRRLIEQQDAAAQQWLHTFAAPIAATPPGHPGTTRSSSLRGKALFDAYRTTNTATTTALSAQSRRLVDDFRTAGLPVGAVLAVLALVAVAVGLRLAIRTHRMLLAPLDRLHEVLDRLTAGDRSARAQPSGPPEVSALAHALNTALDHQHRAETRLRQARDDLAAERSYLTGILDLIPVAVLTCTADGTIRHLNRAARRPAPHTVPATVTDLSGLTEPGPAPDGGTAHPLARALAGETLTQHDMLLHTDDGQRSMLVDARALRGPDGAVTGAITSAIDVTDLREREAELTAFAGVVAHDLRAPLANVAGYADLLAAELPGDDRPIDPRPLRTTLRDITRGLHRMNTLIDDLLAYTTARDAPLRIATVDPNPLIDEVIRERTAHPSATTVDGSTAAITVEPLPAVDADPRMLRQVFDNVIGNAIKYTRPGTPADITISGHLDADHTRITVADRGIGIPARERAAVFTSFHRAHSGHDYSGTGLGLAICHRVMHRHGGTIRIDDNPGGGTRIHLTLPTGSAPQKTRRHARPTAAR